MNLQYVQFKGIDLVDVFFDSLKSDYAEFPDWFKKKAEEFAYVFRNSEERLDGFLYLKIENEEINDVVPPLPAERRLKVGTLKINAHGTKLGERFIKKIFDHAIYEGVNEIYVTVFAAHAPLIALLKRYGFRQRGEKSTVNGTELVLVRVLREPWADVISSYPLVNLKGQAAYLLSLQPQWHTRLLPDSILQTENANVVQDISHANSIHKVYLAAMKGIGALKVGDVLLIYRTSDNKGPAHYRSVATSIGVVEEYRHIDSFASQNDFMTYCRPYSVFTDQELQSFWVAKRYPFIFRFTYNIAFKRRVTRGEMIEQVGLNGDDYWGFLPLSHPQLLEIAKRGMIDESLIVY